MSTTIQNIKQVFRQVEQLNQQQQQIKKLKGENFNLFSILQMEYKENATHSAFLGELLNPEGSHFFKAIFLKLFLKSIGYGGNLNASTAHLELEKHIGKIDSDNKTGGRIDIFISDHEGNSISIENKINAKDQEGQIERYVNHNKERNTVYYLTLDGNIATDLSTGELEVETDYTCISYKQHIIEWLQMCMKEATEYPILRESIRQYIILIKKLTNQLTDNAMEHQVIETIKANYQTARIVADNIWKADLEMANLFLQEVKEELEKGLGSDYEVDVSNDLTQKWTGLSVYLNEWNGLKVCLEGSPKVPWNQSNYGIIGRQDVWDRSEINKAISNIDLLRSGFKHNFYWPAYTKILELDNVQEREKLFNQTQRRLLVESTASKLIELCNLCEEPLKGIPKIEAETN